ncbi:MAG TPA: CsgG/HfaB family protein [Gemmatimonadales bacterium]|jgi:TolB-like protein
MSASQRHSRVLAGVLAVAVSACAGGGSLQLADVTPASLPALQAERAQKPQDNTVGTRLGVAYFRANQLSEARATLDTVALQNPQNGIAAIYRGMTAESQGDFPAARESYTQFIAVAKSRDLKNTANQRLALVGKRELEYSARQALANEAQLSTQPPEPNTIAVMPFAYAGSNPDIQPLSRGFAQLIVTDLAKSRQIRVLERERMQAMVDEMKLGESTRADAATAARSGRMLRAERVVEGSLTDQGNVLRADGAVVDVSTAGIQAAPEAAAQMNQIFDMEKAFVLDLFNRIGIQLTDAERSAIDQRPTQSLAAFLAWSRGLNAEDHGDFAAAQGFYDQAARIDPSFSAASQSSQQAATLQAASTQSVAQVEVAVAAGSTQETGPGAPPTSDAINNGKDGVNPNNTPTSGQGSSTGGSTGQPKTDAPPGAVIPQTTAPTATIRIIIPRP